ncbi:hypothetical protein BDZ45DRAFT_809300 [Acephala macrosclerotiorum]|nr:hypothetical protein BDZ45DRAFT_809300 [Acephala macrosclerotiorum]
MSSAATVFGIPVNGFNFATYTMSTSSISLGPSATITITSQGTAIVSATNASPTSTGSASQQASSKAPSTSPPLGETVGISIATAFAVLLMGAMVYMLWKRRRQARSKPPGPAVTLNPGDRLPLSPRELPTDQTFKAHYVYELSEG